MTSALRSEAAEPDACVALCSPELKLEPLLTVGDLVGARVEDVTTGERRTFHPDLSFELVLATGISTQLPRVGLNLEAILPMPGPEPELEFELNLVLITKEWTSGWVETHFDIVDQLSPSERPGTSAYTHKLDFELDTAFFPFNWQERGNWLRNVELEASLDYLATGLPRRGDVVDGELYLEDARGWSASLALVLPLAPTAPQD